MRRRGAGLGLLAASLLFAGCGRQSALSPHSGPAHDIEVLWWWMLGVAGVVFLGAVALLVLGWIRREEPGLPFFGESDRANMGLVLTFGMLVPIVVLVSLFAVSDLYVIQKTKAPNPGSTALTIDVIGHQWFWEVRYPGSSAVTANEIHIPARTRVNVVGTSADVIHSFWVPELNRKIDLVPGMTNRTLLYADKPGIYRGQCAEFCGVQHAHMGLEVFADPPARFRAWLANMARPTPPASTPQQRRGEQVFFSDSCASCHTLRGTRANGDVGPDLTHLTTRTSIAADTIPNTPAYLAQWVHNPQAVKPGNRMPALPINSTDFRALMSYLTSRR